MNQRVHNLAKWLFIEEGQALSFPKEKRRTVILDVNCPDEVSFYIVQDLDAVRANPEKVTDEAAGRMRTSGAHPPPSAGEERTISFLGIAKGRDRFEFAVDGAFDLVAEGGAAYVYTADGQSIATKVVAPVIFTRIANRRQRNPHLELMQYQMRVNQERLVAKLEVEQSRRIQALEKKLEEYAPQRDQRIFAEKLVDPVRRATLDEAASDDAAGDAFAAPEEPTEERRASDKKRARKSDEAV